MVNGKSFVVQEKSQVALQRALVCQTFFFFPLFFFFLFSRVDDFLIEMLPIDSTWWRDDILTRGAAQTSIDFEKKKGQSKISLANGATQRIFIIPDHAIRSAYFELGLHLQVSNESNLSQLFFFLFFLSLFPAPLNGKILTGAIEAPSGRSCSACSDIAPLTNKKDGKVWVLERGECCMSSSASSSSVAYSYYDALSGQSPALPFPSGGGTSHAVRPFEFSTPLNVSSVAKSGVERRTAGTKE